MHFDAIDRMLLDYAAGALSVKEALMVAALAALDDSARRRVAQYEAMGGRVLESEAPAVVHCREAVLARIGDCGDGAPCDDRMRVPAPLAQLLSGCSTDDSACWGKVRGGVARLRVCVDQTAHCLTLMRLAPHAAVPAHAHTGLEITLVLEGGYEDGGVFHGKGDILVVEDGSVVHSPRAGADGCLCLVLTHGPLRFANPWHRLLELLGGR